MVFHQMLHQMFLELDHLFNRFRTERHGHRCSDKFGFDENYMKESTMNESMNHGDSNIPNRRGSYWQRHVQTE